jgi:hypothetical protein
LIYPTQCTNDWKGKRKRSTTPAETIAPVLEEAEAARNKAFWEKLEAKGLVAKQKPGTPVSTEPFHPIQIQGKPLSKVILEERR